MMIQNFLSRGSVEIILTGLLRVIVTMMVSSLSVDKKIGFRPLIFLKTLRVHITTGSVILTIGMKMTRRAGDDVLQPLTTASGLVNI